MEPTPVDPLKGWKSFCCFEKGRGEKDGLVTVVYELSHVPTPSAPQGLEEFQKMLMPYLTPGKGRIEFSNRLTSFAITDTKENIGYVEKMLQLLHKPDAPIFIEARVVEVRWDKNLQIGVEGNLAGNAGFWAANPASGSFMREARVRFQPTEAQNTLVPFQGSTFRFNSTSPRKGTFDGLVEMFVERGKADILSQPRVLVRANQTAVIFTGDEIPFPQNVLTQPTGTQVNYLYRQAGVRLEVTPRVAAPGQVALAMKPEVTSTHGTIELAPTLFAPEFTVRSVSTDLIVRDGEEIVIGGLYRKNKTEVRRGLPFLSDIPLLGYLFGKTEEEELVQEVLFFIKPTIIKSEQEQPRGVIVPLPDK